MYGLDKKNVIPVVDQPWLWVSTRLRGTVIMVVTVVVVMIVTVIVRS